MTQQRDSFTSPGEVPTCAVCSTAVESMQVFEDGKGTHVSCTCHGRTVKFDLPPSRLGQMGGVMVFAPLPETTPNAPPEA